MLKSCFSVAPTATLSGPLASVWLRNELLTVANVDSPVQRNAVSTE